MVNKIKFLMVVSLIVACAPTVKVEAPSKPIVIDLNVNIEHKIKVQLDKDIDNLMDKNKGLF